MIGVPGGDGKGGFGRVLRVRGSECEGCEARVLLERRFDTFLVRRDGSDIFPSFLVQGFQ
jgi:hypothetical protein